MLIGAHMSISGGIYTALERGHELGCETIQIFTKNASRWNAKELTEKDLELFKGALKATGIWPVVAHDSYLINLAGPDEGLRRRSIDAFLTEMKRAEYLGIPFLVSHLGAHGGAGEEEGLRRLVDSLNEIGSMARDLRLKVLMETTAGQGTALGYRFEHFAYILENVEGNERLGVCFDTAHVFAAGYDVRTEEGFGKVLEEFDAVVGIDRIYVFHANDSKRELGSRIDRHEHIGKGYIGLEAFRFLLNDPRFEGLPMILETPKEGNMDEENLKVLRSLRGL